MIFLLAVLALAAIPLPALEWQAAPASTQPAVPTAPASHGEAQPKAVARPDGPITFQDLIEASGIKFQLKNSISPQRYSIETMMGGVAVFDYNNDGLLDIFFTNGAQIPSLEKSDPSFYNRLYRNNGDGTFTDETEKAGVKGVGYSMGVAAADYDNDGFVDLYIAGVNRNQLLHNNGDGTFSDVTEKAGVAGMVPKLGKAWAVAAGWFDYDNDGRLDLLVINYLDYNIADCKLCSIDDFRTYCDPTNFKGTPNILYRNNGDGTFTDVSAASHIGQYVGKGMGLAFADYDNDGFTDVFVSNDTFPNFLLHNNGDGTFKDVALETGTAYTSTGDVVAGMGAEFRDLNNDGLPDIFHTAMFGNTFPLYKNAGTQFDDVTEVSGMTTYSRRMTAWSTGAFDFDNDGFKDLFIGGGAILDNELEVLHRPTLLPNGLLRNNGNFTFTDVGPGAGASFMVPKLHRGAAFGDFNNDGKIDIVVNILNDKPQLFMNRTANGNHWIILKLVGTRDNRDGLGTRIKVTTAEGVQYNHATTAVGYSSSSDKRVHFGLGKAAIVDKIELQWPTGVKQVLTHVKADQVLTVVEGR
ncbi:MAG: CRTAC1 family protein [Terracidiphilus sp.]|nr:CRTAC1 family protein [Terracidiphilus sp.]